MAAQDGQMVTQDSGESLSDELVKRESTLSWKVRSALAAGVPLGVVLAANPAAAQPDFALSPESEAAGLAGSSADGTAADGLDSRTGNHGAGDFRSEQASGYEEYGPLRSGPVQAAGTTGADPTWDGFAVAPSEEPANYVETSAANRPPGGRTAPPVSSPVHPVEGDIGINYAASWEPLDPDSGALGLAPKPTKASAVEPAAAERGRVLYERTDEDGNVVEAHRRLESGDLQVTLADGSVEIQQIKGGSALPAAGLAVGLGTTLARTFGIKSLSVGAVPTRVLGQNAANASKHAAAPADKPVQLLRRMFGDGAFITGPGDSAATTTADPPPATTVEPPRPDQDEPKPEYTHPYTQPEPDPADRDRRRVSGPHAAPGSDPDTDAAPDPTEEKPAPNPVLSPALPALVPGPTRDTTPGRPLDPNRPDQPEAVPGPLVITGSGETPDDSDGKPNDEDGAPNDDAPNDDAPNDDALNDDALSSEAAEPEGADGVFGTTSDATRERTVEALELATQVANNLREPAIAGIVDKPTNPASVRAFAEAALDRERLAALEADQTSPAPRNTDKEAAEKAVKSALLTLANVTKTATAYTFDVLPTIEEAARRVAAAEMSLPTRLTPSDRERRRAARIANLRQRLKNARELVDKAEDQGTLESAEDRVSDLAAKLSEEQAVHNAPQPPLIEQVESTSHGHPGPVAARPPITETPDGEELFNSAGLKAVDQRRIKDTERAVRAAKAALRQAERAVQAATGEQTGDQATRIRAILVRNSLAKKLSGAQGALDRLRRLSRP